MQQTHLSGQDRLLMLYRQHFSDSLQSTAPGERPQKNKAACKWKKHASLWPTLQSVYGRQT